MPLKWYVGIIIINMETYGAWSEEARNAFSCIAMREAILTNCSKSQVLGDLYGRLSIVLVRANARAILARSLQVADMQVDAMDYNNRFVNLFIFDCIKLII